MGQTTGVASLPGDHWQTSFIPTVAAGDATEEHPIFQAPHDVQILDIDIVPQAGVTGDNTNTKNLNVNNKGSDGTGTTELGNLDLVTGVDLTTFDQQAIEVTDTNLTKGDVLALEMEQVGSGVAIPDLIVMVRYRSRGGE